MSHRVIDEIGYKSNAIMISKSFNDCSLSYLAKTFALKRLLRSPDLDAWLAQTEELTVREKENLQALQELLQFNILSWNEQELALHFIGPIFSLAIFSTEQFNLFAERYIEAIVGEIKLSGKPDGLIATGYFEPEKPFFCFQEYKKEIDNSGDPLGQVLAAMLVGQQLNQDSQLMYGCYVIGRNWHFVTLHEQSYSISQAFEATTPELFDIFRILKALKQRIIQQTTPPLDMVEKASTDDALSLDAIDDIVHEVRNKSKCNP